MRPEADLDLECFHNWFLCGITDPVTGNEWDFQLTADHPLDVGAIRALCQHFTIVTFNGTGYDVPMLMLALTGASNATLKAANDDIIVNRLSWWAFYKKYNCWPPEWFDHIDVMEVAPGVRVSLKQYACRMGSPLVQDTPVDFNAPLPLDHVPEEIYYCRNDRKITRDLRAVVDDRIRMRAKLSERYGVDLRSKSDAQAAEAMVKAEWGRRMRESIDRHATAIVSNDNYWHFQAKDYAVDYRGVIKPTVPHYIHGTKFKPAVSDHIHFVTPYMQEFLQLVRDCEFTISDKDEAELLGMDGEGIKTGVLIPPELKGRDILIGRTKYRVGMGGLHSQESSVSYRSIPGQYMMRRADVASYYPSLIVNAGMNPPQLGPLFLAIYGGMKDDRIAAKAKAKLVPYGSSEFDDLTTIADGFKIVLNGTFGKLFSRYSIFYAPELGCAVTMGGQLALLMLIERLELSGVRVVSANTDGIEMMVPFGYEKIVSDIIAWWERVTGLVMECENYLALYSRDVNNYISMGLDGSVKRKGVFGESGVLKNKHPDFDICADAVVAFLCSGVPLSTTIYNCKDIKKFIRVRGAKGGASFFQVGSALLSADSDGIKHLTGGVTLGRAVRWYQRAGSEDFIVDTKSLNKVAGSDGACPVMRLPDTLPTDIDYPYYVTVAETMLTDIGYGNENQ